MTQTFRWLTSMAGRHCITPASVAILDVYNFCSTTWIWWTLRTRFVAIYTVAQKIKQLPTYRGADNVSKCSRLYVPRWKGMEREIPLWTGYSRPQPTVKGQGECRKLPRWFMGRNLSRNTLGAFNLKIWL